MQDFLTLVLEPFREVFAGFTRFAPNVFVSSISAPAFTYSWCTSLTIAGFDTFNSSKQRLMKTPLLYSIVPIAPSAIRARCPSSARNSAALDNTSGDMLIV